MSTRIRAGVTTAGLAALLALGASCSSDPDADRNQRQQDVAERGAEVMPFDLDKTSHIFTKKTDGVVQTVLADQPDDTKQVTLIRQHLMKETKRFRSGDFTDPTRIHGEDMPGVSELTAGAPDIHTVYSRRPAGATITFTTLEPDLVKALHDWADAQVSDHGSHASHG